VEPQQLARRDARYRSSVSKFAGRSSTNLFGGSKKIAKNKRCYANTLRPRSRMLLKVMKGG
jgi:hypothetical protein